MAAGSLDLQVVVRLQDRLSGSGTWAGSGRMSAGRWAASAASWAG
jgi:hypothetical protein